MTGPYGLKDITGETTDHVNAAYGLLAMLHKIAFCYEYANVDLFKKLKVYFIHAAYKRIRFWYFGLVSEQLYVLDRVGSALLPIQHVGSKKEFMDVTNMMWELKSSIDFSHGLLQEIKRSQEKNKQIIEKRLEGYEKIIKLEYLLAGSAEVKLSSRVSEAEDIYVFSSPLGPQSPVDTIFSRIPSTFVPSSSRLR